MVDSDWMTPATEAAGVQSLIGERRAHSGTAGIASKTSDCLEGIEEAPEMDGFVGATGNAGAALGAGMSWSVPGVGLIGKRRAARQTRQRRMLRLRTQSEGRRRWMVEGREGLLGSRIRLKGRHQVGMRQECVKVDQSEPGPAITRRRTARAAIHGRLLIHGRRS